MAQSGGESAAKRTATGSWLAYHSGGESGSPRTNLESAWIGGSGDAPFSGDGQGRRRSTTSNAEVKTKAFNTTLLFYPNKNPKLRLFALWYFTMLMIVWNV